MEEETLYDIEIHRRENAYVGKIFSDADGVKEFRSEHLDQLLRDITIDMQLALEEFGSKQGDLAEVLQEQQQSW
mgnify:FL=1|jgi:hypothetical protein